MVYSVGFSLNALFANSTSSKLHIHYVSNKIHVADVIVKPIEVLLSFSLFFNKPAQIDICECLIISISRLIYSKLKYCFKLPLLMDPGNKRSFFLPSCTETKMSSLFKFILLFCHDRMDHFMHIALRRNTLRG